MFVLFVLLIGKTLGASGCSSSFLIEGKLHRSRLMPTAPSLFFVEMVDASRFKAKRGRVIRDPFLDSQGVSKQSQNEGQNVTSSLRIQNKFITKQLL